MKHRSPSLTRSKNPWLGATLIAFAIGFFVVLNPKSALAADSVASVNFNPPSGTVPRNTQLSLSTATSGATISYAIHNEPIPFQPAVVPVNYPTISQYLTWQPYTGPITIESNTVVYAKAEKAGYSLAFTDAIYTVPQLLRPEFSPVRGPITNGTLVTITSPQSGATIRYTLDGSDPTNFSPIYGGPIALQANTKLKAKAFLNGYIDSYTRYTFYRAVTNSPPAPAPYPETPHLTFTQFTPVNQPVWIANAGDGTGRVFVVDQTGYVGVIGQSTPFLSFFGPVPQPPPGVVIVGGGGSPFQPPAGPLLVSQFAQLISLAFPPDYDSKAYFYASYQVNTGKIRVARFSAEADPNVADPNSAMVIGDYPYTLGAGQVVFSPDGTLYMNRSDPVANPMPLAFFQDATAVAAKMTPILVESGGQPLAKTNSTWALTPVVTNSQSATCGGLLYRGPGRRMQGLNFFGSGAGWIASFLPSTTGIQSQIIAQPTFQYGQPEFIFNPLTRTIVSIIYPTYPFNIVAIGEDENRRLYIANFGTMTYIQAPPPYNVQIVGGGVYRVEDDETAFSLRPQMDANGIPNLAWYSAVGKQYVIEASSDLKTWRPYFAPLAGIGDTLTLPGAYFPPGQANFFRVQLSDLPIPNLDPPHGRSGGLNIQVP